MSSSSSANSAAPPKSDFGAWFAGVQGAGAAATTVQSAPVAATQGLGGQVTAAFSSFVPAGALESGGKAASVAVATASAGVSSVFKSIGLPNPIGGKLQQSASDVEAGDTSSATPVGSAGSGASGTGSSESSSFLPASLARFNPLAVVTVGGGAASPPEWTCGMTTAQRFQVCLMLLAGSAVLFSMAIFMFLPVVILFPSKFATTFTFGSLMFMAALAILRGPRSTLLGLLQRERLPFSGAYIGSIVLTLYAALVAQSYLLILLSVGVQFSALAWYGASFVPGGSVGMSIVSRYTISALGAGARGLGGLVTGR